MKLLVTDYDNTFHINDSDMAENVTAAKEFMHDNVFAIATGRNYTSFMKQKELYDIPYNYLITNNGATIIKNNEIIYNEFLDDNIKNSILKEVDFDKLEKIVCCGGKDDVTINDSVSKLYFKFYDYEEAKRIQGLISKYDVNIFLYTDVLSMDVVSKNVGKEKAIKYIADLENIEDVYVIGDSVNDYEMIKEYQGYCSVVAKEQIKEISKKQYSKVADLINEIMEG